MSDTPLHLREDLAFLYGADPTEHIVGLHPVWGDDNVMMRVYIREGDTVIHEDRAFYPFFLIDDITHLRSFPRKAFRFQKLKGRGRYRYMVVFDNWHTYKDALDQLYEVLGYVEKDKDVYAPEDADKLVTPGDDPEAKEVTEDEENGDSEGDESDEDEESGYDHRKIDEVYTPGSITTQYLTQSGQTLFKGMTLQDVRRMQIDIETYTESSFPNAERDEDEITIIVLSDNTGWEAIIHTVHDGADFAGIDHRLRNQTDADILPCQSEEELLREFVKVVVERDPDILELHNGFKFDLPYIAKRCEKHGVFFGIGRDGGAPFTWNSSRRFAERSISYPFFSIAGRAVVDTMFMAMAVDVFKRNMPGYGLKVLAKYFDVEGGDGSGADRTYVEGSDIPRVWKQDPERLLRYALDDVRETRAIAEILSTSSFYLTQILPFSYEDCERFGTATMIEGLMAREYIRQRYAIPEPDYGKQSEGGYTDIFMRGVIDRLIYADVESLYPAIMKHYNCQPGKIKDPIDLFPRILRRLTDLRLDAKAHMNDMKEVLKDMPELNPNMPAPNGGQSREQVEHEIAVYDARQGSYKTLINCFDPETEIMTAEGPKNVAEVEPGELVLSVNPETLKTEWKEVTHTHAQENYKGKMVEIKNPNVDLLVTPNHDLLTEEHNGYNSKGYSKKEAQTLFENKNRHRMPPVKGLHQGVVLDRFWLDAHCEKKGIPFKTRVFNGQLQIKDLRQQSSWQPGSFDKADWFEFVGWFISEGSLYKSKRKDYGYTVRGESYKVSIANTTENERNQIRDLLNRMGLSFYESSNGFSISNKLIYEILRREAGKGSANKRIPKWMFLVPDTLLQVLWDSMYLGDGDKPAGRKKGKTLYTTQSQQLAEDVVRLGFHLGFRAKIKDYGEGVYRVGISKSKGIAPVIKHKDRRTVDYEGAIYCLTVADNHTVLAGRNGLFNFVGQSLYGSMGFGMFAWNNFDEADRVALTGQKLIRQMGKIIEEDGGTIIEIDTDGILFTPDPIPGDPFGAGGITVEDEDGNQIPLPRTDEAEAGYVRDLTDRMPEGINIDHDGSFRRMISYKKKNYALLKYDPDREDNMQDPEDMKIKGGSMISRAYEPFGRKFVKEILGALATKDVQAMHDIFERYRQMILTSDWSVEDFQRMETLKDSFKMYAKKVELGHGNGGYHRSARYEVALRDQMESGTKYLVGDRIEYYVASPGPLTKNAKMYQVARHVKRYNGDEWTGYYIDRLMKFCEKFKPFFSDLDWRRIFTPSDGLFGFDPTGIEIKTERVRLPLSHAPMTMEEALEEIENQTTNKQAA